MFKFWKKSNKETPKDKSDNSSGVLTWSIEATKALEQSVAQAPVPGMLKNKVKKELATAAEDTARATGHSEVTAEDLMAGLLSKLPANMRQQVEQAAKQGPEGLKNLEKRLRRK